VKCFVGKCGFLGQGFCAVGFCPWGILFDSLYGYSKAYVSGLQGEPEKVNLLIASITWSSANPFQ